jgi:hypothetical protein
MQRAVDRSRWERQALQVVIEHAEWSEFGHLALILEMRVRVANRAGTRKQLTGFQLQSHSGGQVANGSEDLEISREVEHRKRQHNALNRISMLEHGETVTGWMVYALPWKTTPGEPEYTFSVIDELKNKYEAVKAYAGSAGMPVELPAEASSLPSEDPTHSDLTRSQDEDQQTHLMTAARSVLRKRPPPFR